ncbi:hypothetical protein HYALB_00010309 [Hymenoscyphus albidus]|uniref:Kinesin-like protein n=1 Tax=Hymenoscyphus albidus TaxID=595503 RepID=A0A9N9QD56_9HELO|nr:hypothetical protein HYALB_00010309 [Hymenoscyphus albidus]
MDISEENSFLRESRIGRPPNPSCLPTPAKALNEISESESNTRAKMPVSRLPPPPSTASKHRLNHYEQPEPKRKTLAERAAEPGSASLHKALPAPSTISGVRTTSLKSVASSGYGSQNPSRGKSLNRKASRPDFSKSVGPGHHRSASAAPRANVFSQSTTSRPPSQALTRTRHAPSANNQMEGDAYRKGTSAAFSNNELQAQYSESDWSQRSVSNATDSSVSSALARLRIDSDDDGYRSDDDRAIRETARRTARPSLSTRSSLSNGFQGLRGGSETALVLFGQPEDSLVAFNPKTPSQIPVPIKRREIEYTPQTPSRVSKDRFKQTHMKRHSNIGFVAWGPEDIDNRMNDMDAMFKQMKEAKEAMSQEQSNHERMVNGYSTQILDLNMNNQKLTSENKMLHSQNDLLHEKAVGLERKLQTVTSELDDKVRQNRNAEEEFERTSRNELERLRRDHTDESERLARIHRDEIKDIERRAALELEDTTRALEKKFESTLEEERSRQAQLVQELEVKIAKGDENSHVVLENKDREIQSLQNDLQALRLDLDQERHLKSEAQINLTAARETMQKRAMEAADTIHAQESTLASLRARILFLESGSKAQSDSFAEMEERLQQANRKAEECQAKLIKEETIRRILFNAVQELKGNIRVMARMRPAGNADGEVAQIQFPDADKESKELEIIGKEEKSSLGTITKKTHSFSFDRMFGPSTTNEEVFAEIQQLVQSALDGYNVSIFAYGQTGSGKTHTMSSADGMIPRATHQIYETARNLEEKGWKYAMEGSFIEVYNEEIHDLLSSSKDSEKKKHEIRHDDQKKQTIVTGIKTVPMTSVDTVEMILKQADSNRRVAATKSNERSSRSHSVFMLKLVGHNSTTGETSEGTLNLVDLAGSERLKSSGAEGDRKKETQNINKSLSCLGDVIAALGQGKEGSHIPYRNSKLTHLLQYSLGGNSKTLMFVMASPMQAHLTETLTSLKFATKVHNTHIGTAKKSTKVKN